MNFSECLKDAVSYWERKRILYNAVLVVLTLICWGPDILPGGPRAWIGGGLVVLVFAGIANVLYSLAYPVDLVLQMSPYRTLWLSSRWLLFTTGLLLAVCLALQIMLGDGMA